MVTFCVGTVVSSVNCPRSFLEYTFMLGYMQDVSSLFPVGSATTLQGKKTNLYVNSKVRIFYLKISSVVHVSAENCNLLK